MLLSATPPVQPQSPQTLRNHVMPAVTQGTAPMVAAMSESEQMSFSIVLPLRNQSELTSLLKRLYDPSSPDYRQFLSVAEFTERFGPTAQDYETVASYARANGFTLAEAPANRMVLSLTGTAAQVENAFGVRMNYYQHPTENRTFFSPDREPSVDLAVKIAHISGLNNFYLPRPAFQLGSNVQSMASVNGSGPGGSYLGSDMRAAYYGGSTLDGNGQVVGLLEFEGYNKSDVDLTFSNAGQTYKVPVTNVLLNGMTGAPVSSGGEAEVVLDIVQAIGMAPGLKQVRVYIGNNDASMLNSMASENIAKQIGCSWSWRPDDPAVADPFFQEMAAQGQSFFTASGDNGAFAANVPFYFPAEDTYVTAVGGTHLTTSGAGGSWASETAWNSSGYGSGGGVSPDSIGIPSWQTGVASTANGGSTTLRNVPDVAMEADFDNYMCYLGGCYTTGAGTSFAAPRWAGFMAMVNQQAIEAGNAPKGGLGFINPTIYAIGSDSRFTSEMHDTTSGNNQTAGQSVWYSAVTGYDLVTGWGSANGQNLIDELAGRQVPGFWIAAADGTVSLNQGKTSTTTITVTDAADFSGSVNLAVTSTLPTGVTASWGTNPTTNTSVLTFTATASAPESSTQVTITGTSGSLTATTTLILAVHPPTFTLSPSPATVSVNPGNSITSTITVTPKYGFSGNVTLAASGLPAGVTATWGTNPTTGTSVLTLATSSSTLGGTYPITITGTSGSITATTTVSLVIQAPSFRITGTSSVNIGQNASGSAYFYVTQLYGFNGTVNFTVSGLPTGVSAYFAPASTTYSTTLYLSGSAAVPGQYSVTVTGTSGNLTSSTTFTLGVYEPNFTISTYGPVNVGQGSSSSTSVSVNAQYGFNSNVTLSVSGLPSGVSALWNPNPTSSGSSLTLIASSSTQVGQSTLTITGKSGGLSASTTLTLAVYAPTFTLSGSSSTSIGQGSTASNYVYVNSQYGFNGSVNLSVTGLPSGVTAAFSPNPTTGSSNLTFTASSSAAVGQYPLTVTGTSGTITKTFSMTLGVYAPTFTLSGGNVTIGQGKSTTGYVYVNSQYGFSGNVSLSISGLPSGVTATFSPNPATYYSQITFTAADTAAVGQYPLTITGTSGSKTVTTPMTLGVYAPRFTLSGYGASIAQGTSGSSSLYIDSQYGFNSPVTLAVSGLPSGVTATFSQNPTTGYYNSITFSASSSAAIGQYPLTITGTSGSLTATTTMTLGIYAPSFTLSGSSVSMGQGTSGYTYVSIYSQYGYSGSVTLSASGLPSGLTAAFTTNPTTSGSQIVFTSSASLAPGQYPVTITGTSGSLTATTSVVVTVYAAGFTISTPYFGSINPGTKATGTVYVYPQYGFSGNVTLAVSGLPSGVTAAFATNPTTSSSVLTLTVSNSAAPGTSQITITGTSGSVSGVGSTSITITQQSFTISDAPGAVTLASGGTTKSSVLVNPLNGFSGNINFTVTGLPAGVTASFSPNPSTGSTVMTLTADSTVSAGSATVTITGTSGGSSASTTLTVNVVPASSATSTSLAAISNGAAVTTITSGSPISLTAGVKSGSSMLTSGEVIFCQDAGSTCDVGHRFASALLGANGTAVARFIPGPGSHSYTATYLGSSGISASTSSAAALTVTAALATTTTLSSSGTSGNYTLSTTVTGQGRFAPSGSVSFLDTTTNNATIKTVTLSPSQTNASFTASPSSVGNTSLYGLSSGDLNGDGVTDLIIGNTYSKQVSILLGKGDGTFTATSQGLTTTSQPLASVTGDFNGDGKLDLAIICSNANALSFFLGNGDGTFTASTTLVTGNSPTALVADDFNRDGKLDIAVVNNYSNTVNIFLGNGDATFTNSQSPQTGSSPRAIVAADFNNDGLLDLAIVNQSSFTVSILLGSGDGSFTAALSPATDYYPVSIAAGDLNGDGNTDLVVTNSSGYNLTVLLGSGTGTFTAATVTTNTSPGPVVVADFNGDGKQDVLYGTTYLNNATLLPGKGDGTFGSGTNTSTGTGSNVSALLAGDYNGDGIPDVVALNSLSSVVTTLLSKWVQTAGASAAGVFPLGQGQHQVKASYAGDAAYQGSSSSAVALTAQAGPPTVTVTPASTSIFVMQPLTVTVSVAAGAGYPTATGTVILTSGSYSAQQTLASGSASFTVPANTLAVGNDTLSAAYTPDTSSTSTYTNANGTAAVAVASTITPTVIVTPAASTITTAQPLSVSVNVAGGNGNPTPTGTVTLTNGGYSAQQTLSSGSATFNIAAGTLSVGNAALAVAYTPDTTGAMIYKTASGSGTVTVTQAIGSGSAALAMTVSPATITDKQTTTVSVSVAGPSGQAVPTGTVTLSSGTYTSQLTLANGSASISVSGSSLSSGSNTLSATYSGDGNYASATGSGTVTVAPVAAAGTTPSPVNRGSNTTATITFNAGSSYSGTMNVLCTLTASPSGAQNVPTCSLSPASFSLAAGGSGTTTLTIRTTAPTSAALTMPGNPRSWGAGLVVAAFALPVLWCMPRRRKLIPLLMLLMAITITIGSSGCAGGGKSSSSTGSTGTTAGSYTFTVTGTDATNTSVSATTAVTVTVQ